MAIPRNATNANINRILTRLERVKLSGDGWKARCPAHEDANPSLHIRESDSGRILLHCFAGCEFDDIISSLGLRIPDLFPDGGREEEHRRAPIVATYDYHDANGQLLHQVCRTADKKFFQRRPVDNGEWEWGLKGIRPVLYHLPQLRQAVQTGGTVFVVEGEKDVLNLEKQGLVATTNPMGAGHWRNHYTEELAGASVVVLPDNDKPGREHAEQVATSLRGKAASVKVLELPDLGHKQDVSDWLSNVGTIERLLEMVKDCPEWKLGAGSKSEKRREANEEDAEELRPLFISCFMHQGHLYEQVHEGGNSYFLTLDDSGEVQPMSSLEKDGREFTPLDGDELTLEAVRLPKGVEEYGDALVLLRDIEDHIYAWLDVSDRFRKFASYYVLLSWLYDRFHTLPYLRFLGDTGCGKSRALDVVGGLCYKPIMASGCVTPAPIYRMLRRWGGTLVLDEADLKNSDEYNEVVTILNCGFEKGRPVIRATKDNPDQLQILPVYGPKVFATRRRFQDAALEARCLTEIMTETEREDIPPVLTLQFHEEQKSLRSKLLLYRLRNWDTVDAEATVPLDGIEPRLKQISGPFTALLGNQPHLLDDYRAFIREHQADLVEQRANTKTGQVVTALFKCIESPATLDTLDTLATGEKVVELSAKDIAQDIGLSPQAVGGILKGLGIRTKKRRVGGFTLRCIVYDPRRFDVLKRRYIAHEQDEGVSTVATVATVAGLPGEELTPSQKRIVEEFEQGVEGREW